MYLAATHPALLLIAPDLSNMHLINTDLTFPLCSNDQSNGNARG